MKFSVITPSFNQAQFLPDNLRTVSAQKGVELEHIIVDPGSTDGSTEIAQKAGHAILINEPDRGQSHGINKGYKRATGDILVWLNSDDFYPDDQVLRRVADAFARHPEADIIYGNANFVDEQGAFLRKGYVNRDAEELLKSFEYQVGIVQPGVFMRRHVFEAVGGPSEDYNYCMDYEYWVRKAAAGFRWVFIDEVLAHHRWWPGMKTSSGRGDSLIEHFRVCATYFGYIHHKWLDRYGEFVTSSADGVVNHAAAVDPKKKDAAIRRTIERFVTQEMLAQLEKADSPEQRETLAFIRDKAPDMRRFVFDHEELADPVSTHPDPLTQQRVAWHIPDTVTADGQRFKSYTVPQNFARAVKEDWFYYQTERAREKLQQIAAKRKDACVIVANGPSLNKSNLDLLAHADVIVSNFAVLSKQIMQHATYLTIVNDLVAKQGATQFNGLDVTKFFPFWLANSLNPFDNTYFLPATVQPEFCTRHDGIVSWRSTVSFLNMQLAFLMGYERVILIGFDHSYKQAPGLKEGAAVDQTEEDENHFDPRYFRGKTWQAADTGNMEKMYLLARDAYAQAGRSIVNATVGGKLEVFPRKTLEEALGLTNGAGAMRRGSFFQGGTGADSAPSAVKAVARDTQPRLLIFDMTAMGNGSATGELKSTLLKDWPDASLMQIAKQGPHGLAKVTRDGVTLLDERTAQTEISAFDPDLILYRPVPDADALHALAMTEIRRRQAPLATWIMDDWPARMAAESPDRWKDMEPDLEYLLQRSGLRLSISEQMSRAFALRYGVDFVPLANGVDPQDWPAVQKSSSLDGIFRIRFAGGLAPDMNRDSVLRIAEAAERIAASGRKISFQINTQRWWLDQTRELFSGFRHTQLHEAALSPAAYRRWISQADAVLIAYNFDSDSRRYVQYSMANKMPECLASGSVVIAHGPKGIATIDYLAEIGSAVIIPEDSLEAVEAGLRALLDDPERAAGLAAQARELVFKRHCLADLRASLVANLHALIGPTAAGSASGKPMSAVQPTGCDLLETVAREVLSGRGSSPGLFSRLLYLSATELLLDADRALDKLDGDILAEATLVSLDMLGSEAPACRHFQSALKFAQTMV